MKSVYYITLLIAILLSCKKEDAKPATFTSVSGGSPASSLPRVKSIRVENFDDSGGITGTSNAFLTYDAQGRLIASNIIDSLPDSQNWLVMNSIISYSYTAFNKVSGVGFTDGINSFAIQYLFNNNKQVGEIWNGSADTIRYINSGNLIIKEFKSASQTTSRSYYSENLDSTLTFINSTLNNRTVYNHNTRLDKTTQYNNQFYDLIDHKHELESQIVTSGLVTLAFNSTRSYLGNGNISEVIVRLNSELYNISRYTYY